MSIVSLSSDESDAVGEKELLLHNDTTSRELHSLNGYHRARTTVERAYHTTTHMAADDSDEELINVNEKNSLIEQPNIQGATGSEVNRLDGSTQQSIINFDYTMRQRSRLRSHDYYVNQERKRSKSYYDDFVTIDWVRDRNRDRIRHKRLEVRRQLSWRGWGTKMWDALSGWLIVFLVGVSSGLLAGVIDVASEYMSDLKEGFCPSVSYYNKESCCWYNNESNVNAVEQHCDLWKEWSDLASIQPTNHAGAYIFNYALYVVLAVFMAGLSGLYVISLAPYASGSGIPEVKTILSGFIIRGYLGAWTLLVKSVGMVLAVGAGLSLGKEGPLVHVACCAGNLFTRVFPKYYKNEAKKREVLSAAAAAGVSVAFGAPVGGVLFSLEEVSYYFPHKVMWRAFFAALTAAFTLQLMNPYFSGHLVLFYANYDHQWHLFEFVPFLLIGAFGGLYGALFIWCNIKWNRLRKRAFSKFPLPLVEVLVVALITGMLQFPNPYTRTNPSQVIRKLFSQCGPTDNNQLCDYNKTNEDPTQQYHDTQALAGVWTAVWELILAMIVKAVLTIFTFGMKVPAGLFIPSMFVGACFGRVVGICMEQLALYVNLSFQVADYYVLILECGVSIGLGSGCIYYYQDGCRVPTSGRIRVYILLSGRV